MHVRLCDPPAQHQFWHYCLISLHLARCCSPLARYRDLEALRNCTYTFCLWKSLCARYLARQTPIPIHIAVSHHHTSQRQEKEAEQHGSPSSHTSRAFFEHSETDPEFLPSSIMPEEKKEEPVDDSLKLIGGGYTLSIFR